MFSDRPGNKVDLVYSSLTRSYWSDLSRGTGEVGRRGLPLQPAGHSSVLITPPHATLARPTVFALRTGAPTPTSVASRLRPVNPSTRSSGFRERCGEETLLSLLGRTPSPPKQPLFGRGGGLGRGGRQSSVMSQIIKFAGQRMRMLLSPPPPPLRRAGE